MLERKEVDAVFKLFTLEGATKMIPIVDARLHELQDAIADLQRTQTELQELPAGSVETLNARQELGFLVRSVHDARRAVATLGVQVPDIDRGVVEFPSRVGGEVVHLVWEPGRDAITHYHRLTGGEDEHPLEPLPHSREREPRDARNEG